MAWLYRIGAKKCTINMSGQTNVEGSGRKRVDQDGSKLCKICEK